MTYCSCLACGSVCCNATGGGTCGPQGCCASYATASLSYSTGICGAGSCSYTPTSLSGVICGACFCQLLTNVCCEMCRRNRSAPSGWGQSNPINHSDFNSLVNYINQSSCWPAACYQSYCNGSTTPCSQSSAGAPSGVPANANAGDVIYSSCINALVSAIVTAGNACTCNCNYCTCNCNYCTCNCNYTCTCNCNYSDIRLKKNIKLLKTIKGINIYSFNYEWDDTEQIGVMAQELLESGHDYAVTTDSNGFYMVDYSKLPVKM